MMKISGLQLSQLVEKSSTFKQRLNGNFHSPGAAIDERYINKQLALWRKVVGYDDQALLDKRFAWDELTPVDIQRAFSPLQWKSEKPLPSWTDTLAEAVTLAGELSMDVLEREQFAFLNAQEPFPFEEALIPFILTARQQLQQRLQTQYELLAPQAHAMLERLLLYQLSFLSQQTFYLEFCIVRSQKHSRLDMRVARDEQPDDALYRAFVHRFFAGEFVAFFMEYAVLARLMSTAVDFWITNNSEMINRLAIDWPLLSAEFALPMQLERVTAVKPGLSDPHNNGRSVCLFTFSSGFKIVYKPKSLGMDAAFSHFLEWVNMLNTTLNLQTLKIVDRTNYGWVEYVEHHSCANKDEIKRYYHRMGMLLALVYLLQGTDCHSENIIAAGEQPVLIDLETLMHPRVPSFQVTNGEQGSQSPVMSQFQGSVMRTAMLPMWISKSDGKGYDPSGLGGDKNQESPDQELKWLAVNTDQMSYKQVCSDSQKKTAVPLLEGTPIDTEGYVTELIAGFEEMYDILWQQKELLLAEDGPLASFQQLHGRFVNRHTVHYFLLHQQLLQPKYLRDGMARSIQLDALAKCGTLSANKPHFWHLVAPEVESMESLDIPYFTYNVNDNAIFYQSQLVAESYFTQTSFALAQQGISTLSPEDKARQVGYIYAAFKLRSHRSPAALPAPPSAWLQPNIPDVPMMSDTAVIQHILAIAEDIARQAILSDKGSASWIGLEYIAGSDQAAIQPLGANLHSGVCGISLFLAAVEQVTNTRDYRQLALGAIQPLRLSLHQNTPTKNILSGRMSLGGALGIGSLVYAFTRLSHFLKEPSLLEDALILADIITPERIKADTKLDVIEGCAGALLGLVTLYEHTGSNTVLQKAITCGLHLTQSRVTSETGQQAWPTLNENRLLTGFSHGAAGIAYALLRLYHITGDTQFSEAAVEGIEYENNFFSIENQNWLDILRSNKTRQQYGSTWCHGAPGIGLARLGGLVQLNNDEIQRDIAAALQTTQPMMTGNLDTPCCGNLGRNELFLVAGHIQDNPELIRQARQNVSWILARKQAYGHFHLPHGLGKHGQDLQPGFFHGMAGVGYHLLRVLQPELPSVLMWA